MYDLSYILTNPKYKKCFLLIKTLIFTYHGLNEEELELLDLTAQRINGRAELDWALEFVKSDEKTAFMRTKEFFEANFSEETTGIKLFILEETWIDNNKKGFITELEAVALLKFSKVLHVEKEFLSIVRTTA